jgi:hypothetical protein
MAGLIAETYRSLAVQGASNEQGTGNEQARIEFGDVVSGNYFSVLGVAPALGRSFLPEEDSPAAKGIVALLSFEAWQAEFHSARQIAGARIKLNGEPVTIIGVLPRGFRGTGTFMQMNFYLPLAALDRRFLRIGRWRILAAII